MPRVSTILTILLTISAIMAFWVKTASAGLPSETLSRIERSAAVMVDTKSGNYCTVFPISEDGYLLTAAHCLKRCLEEKPSEVQAGNRLEFFCSEQSIPSLGIKGVKVVAMGDALRPQTRSTRFGDFAVLKIETQKPLSCLTLSEKSLKAGDEHWAFGYPVPRLNAKTLKLKASVGKLYGKPEQSRFYKAQHSDLERSSISQLYSRLSGVMYSDAHHLPGQSGGPVIDKEGNVTGIISGFTVTHSGKKEVHELVAGSTEKILKTLGPALADLLAEKSRACQTDVTIRKYRVGSI